MTTQTQVQTTPTTYEVVRKLPVARFYYQGNHTHPIRRTILIIESDRKYLKGYELRCGKKVRTRQEAPIRTYLKSEIAKFGDYSRLRNSKKNAGRAATESTLVRTSLKELALAGA
jgi:hypothetical protein